MAWVYLILAGILEVVWALGLKSTNGFTRFVPSIFTIVSMGASFTFLSMALKTLPIGTAYAIWTGIGAVGTVIFGMIFLGEPRDIMRIVFVLLIISGIIGLKLTAGPQESSHSKIAADSQQDAQVYIEKNHLESDKSTT